MRTLLIADDNDSVLRTLECFLGHSGFRVLPAPSGTAALEIARMEPIDAALIDLHMPGLDGFQTCSALQVQAREHSRTLPVWLMTGAFTQAAEKRGAELGAVAVLSKPFNCQDFVASVEKRWAEPAMPVSATSPMPTVSPAA